MKRIQYIASIALASLLALNLSGCGENSEVLDADGRGIEIEGVSVTMEGMSSEANASTRAAQTQDGFSVNKEGTDPTYARPEARTGWEMNFTVYNSDNTNVYLDGSFTVVTNNISDSKWAPTEEKYFPNYTKPQAEVYIYHPAAKDTEVVTDQSDKDKLLSQDILFRAKGVIEVAHIPAVTVKHKRSMLNFVIKDVVIADINEVKVLISTTEYTPCKVSTETTGTGDIEYMLILPETTNVNPVVQIKTKSAATDYTIQTITYRQTININDNLGSNKCYCFTLQGADLKISPVTVLNWASGESLPGEYIAVTAYPTFKGRPEDAGKTYYFYYDNKLTENGKPKLQEITFNQNAECTIKPDGRILTYIYKGDQVNSTNKTPLGENGKEVTIILNQMVIDLSSVMPTLE